MNLTLRSALPEDLAPVYDLETWGFTPGIRENIEVFDLRIRHFPQGFLLLERDPSEGLLGYFCCEIWKEKAPGNPEDFELGHDIRHSLDLQGTVLYIASLTLAPKFQGQGLSRPFFRLAVDRMKQQFPRLRQGLLIVNETWTAARLTYEKEGFITSGRLRAFFTPEGEEPQDALIMERDL